jgi:hypothetical protein
MIDGSWIEFVHILALKEIQVYYFEGGFSEYEENKKETFGW